MSVRSYYYRSHVWFRPPTWSPRTVATFFVCICILYFVHHTALCGISFVFANTRQLYYYYYYYYNFTVESTHRLQGIYTHLCYRVFACLPYTYKISLFFLIVNARGQSTHGEIEIAKLAFARLYNLYLYGFFLIFSPFFNIADRFAWTFVHDSIQKLFF